MALQEIVEQNYNYSETYFNGLSNRWNKISYPIISKLLKNVLETYQPETVLDLGCGNGIYFDILKMRSASVYGIDVSEQSVILCRKKGYTEVKLADAVTLPFPDNHFNFVFTSEVLEHVENHVFMLEEITRVLKPGGILFLTTTCYSTSIFQFALNKNRSNYIKEIPLYFGGFFSKEKRNRFVRKWCFESLGGHYHGFLPSSLQKDVEHTGMTTLVNKTLFMTPPIPVDAGQISKSARISDIKQSVLKKTMKILASGAISILNPTLRFFGAFANNVYILGQKK